MYGFQIIIGNPTIQQPDTFGPFEYQTLPDLSGIQMVTVFKCFRYSDPYCNLKCLNLFFFVTGDRNVVGSAGVCKRHHRLATSIHSDGISAPGSGKAGTQVHSDQAAASKRHH